MKTERLIDTIETYGIDSNSEIMIHYHVEANEFYVDIHHLSPSSEEWKRETIFTRGTLEYLKKTIDLANKRKGELGELSNKLENMIKDISSGKVK
jgi:hypothetical protein